MRVGLAAVCLLGGLGASLPAVAEAPPGPADPGGFRGLWVLAEGSQRVLEDPARIDKLIRDARALKATDLFVQVYRSGRAWYRSTLADPTPYRQMVAGGGVDGLHRLLIRARSAGLRVHAWVNVLSLNANREAPILSRLGPDAILVDRAGRSLLDYPAGELPRPDRSWLRMGSPGIYLDPGAPGVREQLVATFVELLAAYPELDGLHLDYIRHPAVLPFVPGSRFAVGQDFGYGAATRARYRTETGLAAPYLDRGAKADAQRWDDWRRDQVTEVVSAIRTAVLRDHPELLISAAVIAYPDRAYLSMAQDWRHWLAEGLVDFAVPMIYTRDERLFRHQVAAYARAPHAERIWMGVGSWLFAQRPERALAQLAHVREVGSAGDVLFSYDSIVAAPALFEALTVPGAVTPPVPAAGPSEASGTAATP